MNKRRAVYAALLLSTVVAGLAWRMVPMGLSAFWFKYGGSALWAMALYWLIAAWVPRWSAVRVACVAGVVAALVEFSRLWHVAAVDAFRLTLAGRLLLGRFFSPRNIAAYWVAILLAGLLDRWLVRATGSVEGRDR